MPVTVFRELRTRIYTECRDDLHMSTGEDTLDLYLNEAQEEYARRTKQLTAELAVTATGKAEHPLPDDYLECLRFRLADGTDIEPTAWQRLVAEKGADFFTATGTPEAAVFDFGGENTYRLCPFPETEGEAVGTMTYARLPQANTLEIRDTDALVYYALAQLYLCEARSSLVAKAVNYLDLFRRQVRKAVR